MLEILVVTLFLLVATGTAWAGLRATGWSTRRIERLTPVRVQPAGAPPARTLIWRELVRRIGAAVPASGRDLPRLKRLLIRAGYRNPNAARTFQGIRPVTTLLCAAGGLFLSWQSHAASDNLVWSTAAAALFGFTAPMQF